MTNLLADFSLGGVRGRGPLGLEVDSTGSSAPTVFSNLLSSIIGLMTIIAGIWFLFLFITGAISIITSGEDKGALENARKRLTTGLVGLVVVVASVFLVDLIGRLIGLNLILNPAAAFNSILIP